MNFEHDINKVLHGDCISIIKEFSPESINCVITSPPYWKLRDYGWDGQWGQEKTFGEYLEHLWSLMNEIWRVLKNDGTAWINLGDTYGKHHDIANKCLLLLPHRFAIGCMERGWIIRNDIVWAKRNSLPEGVTDRFSKKHEYFFLMAKNEKYHFDLDSIRDKCQPLNRWGGNKLVAKGISKFDEGTGHSIYRDRNMQPNDGMKNPGDVADFWDIPTQPNNDNHFAAYNLPLIIKPIMAGCPEKGIILDPFCGTATTGYAAILHDRKFIGIEGNEKWVTEGNYRLNSIGKDQTLINNPTFMW